MVLYRCYVRCCIAVLTWCGAVKPITAGVLVVHVGLSFSLRRRAALHIRYRRAGHRCPFLSINLSFFLSFFASFLFYLSIYLSFFLPSFLYSFLSFFLSKCYTASRFPRFFSTWRLLFTEPPSTCGYNAVLMLIQPQCSTGTAIAIGHCPLGFGLRVFHIPLHVTSTGIKAL
jgi:hypothetical protein